MYSQVQLQNSRDVRLYEIEAETIKTISTIMPELRKYAEFTLMFHKAYGQYCYADSTVVIITHWEFIGGEFIDSASYDPTDIGYYVDYYKIIETYTHREPTFVGYVEWLEKLFIE